MPQTSPYGPVPLKPLSAQHHRSPLLIPLIIVSLLLVAALAFGGWAYMSRQDYKTNSDKKSAVAVAAAEKALEAKKDAEFVEKEKSPFKLYKGPATFGSVNITYPKTWSTYVTESSKANIPVDGYMHPNVVPGVQSDTAFALHFQVINTSYDQELKKYETASKTGAVRASAFVAPKVANVTGIRLDGEIETRKQGSAVLLPLRDKTLILVTETTDFNADFTNIILTNLTFVP